MSLEEDNTPILLEDLGMMFATESSKRKVRFGLYKCGHCGKEFKAHTDAIIQGNTKSCGCLKRTHGLYKNKFYKTWEAMKNLGSYET